MPVYITPRYTPVNGGTVVITANDERAFIDPAGALLSLTLEVVPSWDNGTTVFVNTTKTIISISYDLHGSSNDGLPITLLANTGFTMFYVTETDTWYKA